MQIKHFHVLFIALILSIRSYSQQVGINEDGSLPNAHAILDVKSFNKGILIPRMSTPGRLAIPAVKGLLVYDTTTNSFWYNTGSAWQNLNGAGPNGNPWFTTGNNALSDSNFLGTTDYAPLRIRVNNEQSGLIDPRTLNTFWGFRSGGLNSAERFAYINTAIGAKALSANLNGSENVAVGDFSLNENTSGKQNTALGSKSLLSNISGNSNTAIGHFALIRNNGNVNTAVGISSLANHETGDFNTATGAETMGLNNSGSFNLANGAKAMYNLRNGHFNTGVGAIAMNDMMDGSSNTSLGAFTSVKKFGSFNATAIGFFAFAEIPNKVRIGNSVVSVIEGAVPFTTPSDSRFKYNVQEDVKGLDFILRLRPVTYQFDAQRYDETQRSSLPDSVTTEVKEQMQQAYKEFGSVRRSGFLAQEVEKAADATRYNFSGLLKPKDETSHYSISYESFVVPIVKAVQEQQKQIVDQNKLITQLQQQLAAIQQLLKQSK